MKQKCIKQTGIQQGWGHVFCGRGRLGWSELRGAQQSSRLKAFVTCGNGECHIGWRPLWLVGMEA